MTSELDPFDFGEDISCLDDMSEEGRIVTGKELLSEALIRRWTTPRGGLLDDEDYGTDLTEYLNEDVDQLALSRIRSEIRAEALKDERVTDCLVQSANFDVASGRIAIVLMITCGTGSFRLTVAVTSVTVELLSTE